MDHVAEGQKWQSRSDGWGSNTRYHHGDGPKWKSVPGEHPRGKYPAVPTTGYRHNQRLQSVVYLKWVSIKVRLNFL